MINKLWLVSELSAILGTCTAITENHAMIAWTIGDGYAVRLLDLDETNDKLLVHVEEYSSLYYPDKTKDVMEFLQSNDYNYSFSNWEVFMEQDNAN